MARKVKVFVYPKGEMHEARSPQCLNLFVLSGSADTLPSAYANAFERYVNDGHDLDNSNKVRALPYGMTPSRRSFATRQARGRDLNLSFYEAAA